MKHVVIRITGAIEHSKGWHDEPLWWFIIKDVLPKGGREHVIGASNCYCRRYVERRPSGQTGCMGGIRPIGKVNKFPGASFG